MLVDERSTLDLLTFAQNYSKDLVYYDAEDKPAGDWGGLLDGDLTTLAALVDETASGDEARRIDAPHLALFLAFLRLLRHARDLTNTFTRRHLDFYYEEFLRMTRKAAVPDQVHVLLRLARGSDSARVPEGTVLRAGKNADGRERRYRTDHELIVTRARVARLSSVFVQREVVGLREAREANTGTREEAIVGMLKVALGAPRPGDTLPLFGDKRVTYDLLLDVKVRIDFVDAQSGLFMDLADLQSMMKLVHQRAGDDAGWSEIYRALEIAGQTRRAERGWKLVPTPPRNFDVNLVMAVGPVDFTHTGIPEVRSLDDLYDQRVAHASEVDRFVSDKLFLSKTDFERMMQAKRRIDNEWREISRILEDAGRRRTKRASFKINPSIPTTDFAGRLRDAIDPPFVALTHVVLAPVTDIETFFQSILDIERYFYMSAAKVGYVLAVADRWVGQGARGVVPSHREWDRVDALLTDAYLERLHRAPAALKAVREATTSAAAGFNAVLKAALGRTPDDPGDVALADLRRFIPEPGDHTFLEAFQSRVHDDNARPPDQDWERVYNIMDVAQRVREGLRIPAAQRMTWLNLHARADATSAIADPGSTGSAVQRPWKLFGQSPPEDTKGGASVGTIGWAVTSPALLLAQGQRDIILTIGFLPGSFDAVRLSSLFDPKPPEASPLGVELSTAKGWLTPESAVSVSIGDYQVLTRVTRALTNPLRAIQIRFTLGEGAAAVAPPQQEATGMSAPWPVLRLTLRSNWNATRGQHVSQYEALRNLVVAAVHLQATVTGLVPSSIQNDVAVLSSKKPFEPFGSIPAVGSRFYVGDPELAVKRLDSLTFSLDWLGVPRRLDEHYAAYGDAIFTAQVSLIDHRDRVALSDRPVALFATPDATVTQPITLRGLPASAPPAVLPTGTQVTTWPRYLEWELTPNDFKHRDYPTVVSQNALAAVNEVMHPTVPHFDASRFKVNPPYTPKIKSLRLSYTARTEIQLDVEGAPSGEDRVLHIHPFGWCPAEAAVGGVKLLPQYDHEGELYIGLQGAKPSETLSLLFQMSEGSASHDDAAMPVGWSYLSGDRWLTLHDGHILSDTTGGLVDSGIVRIALPPTEPSTRLPDGLFWIRVAIPDHAASVCDVIAIHAQAVSATAILPEGALDGFTPELPPGRVAGLLQRMPQIAAVEQPYASRGGRAAEARSEFYTRVSERLRHKQRALTPWDYERLVLERFPEIYKVKCVPADSAQATHDPGTVRLIVIPRVRDQSSINPFEPRVPAARIAEIEQWLSEIRPPQASLRVQNARFVQVKVRVGVRFRGRGDDGFYTKLLNEDLNRYLSPWAYDDAAEIVIGERIHANSVVSFIDGRDYVDYVAHVELFRSEDGRTFTLVPRPSGSEPYVVSTEGPDGVLVAGPRHEIDIIPEVGYSAASFIGINYMRIELDFIVTGSR